MSDHNMHNSDIGNTHLIYSMKLHEEVSVSSKEFQRYLVTRVPGGWIYSFPHVSQPSIFVPFSNEFMEVVK